MNRRNKVQWIGMCSVLLGLFCLQPDLHAQNLLKRVSNGITNMKKSNSSSSSSQRKSTSSKKQNREILKDVAKVGLFASEAYQQLSGNRLSSGTHTAIDLAQGVTVNSLGITEFQSLSLSEQTSITRKSSSQLGVFNSTRESRYRDLRQSNSKAEIEMEQKKIAEVRSEAESRLKLVTEQVEAAGDEVSDEMLELKNEADILRENVSHLLDIEGLFAGLSSRQNSISRDYVGSFLSES